MKKAFFSAAVALLTLPVLAAVQENLLLTLSTDGPDAYADGTPVAVGETYLLVYVKAGAAFGGVRMDGTLVDPENNAIATRAYAVAGAKCGLTPVQYPPALFPEGGSWVVVLLDTRRDDGTVGGLVAGYGQGAAGKAPAAQSTGLAATAAGGGLSASAPARAPAETPRPEIAAFEPAGGTVNLRIRKFASNVLYEVQTRTSLTSGEWVPAPGAARVQAEAGRVLQGAGGEAELSAEAEVGAGDTARFFRVVVKGSN
jgi:hypothetical protein